MAIIVPLRRVSAGLIKPLAANYQLPSITALKSFEILVSKLLLLSTNQQGIFISLLVPVKGWFPKVCAESVNKESAKKVKQN